MSNESIREYLRSRGRVELPADTIASVMAAVDAVPLNRHAFMTPMLGALGAAAAVAAIAIGVLLIDGARFGPSGEVPDCETDPTGLLRYAVQQLEATPGYRWTEEEQTWGLDPDVPINAGNPQFDWSGYTGEGAYVAPDRMRVALTQSNQRVEVGPLGFAEVVHVGGLTYAYSPGGVTDESGQTFDWQLLPTDFGANRLRGIYPDVDELTTSVLEPADLSWDLPGDGGCEIIRAVATPVPSGAIDMRDLIIAARVNDAGQIVAGAYEALRPYAADAERHSDYRYRFEVTDGVPAASEIDPPDSPVYTYPPSPAPSASAPSASAAPSATAPAPSAPVESAFDVLESEPADALFDRPDTCANGTAGYTATFPDDWYTNTEVGDVPACSWFTPEFFEVGDPVAEPDEIWISIGVIDGAFGYTSISDVFSNEPISISGYEGHRAEYHANFEDDPDHRVYHYVIPFGVGGPTLVASTDTESAGDYELARAVLDRMMASMNLAAVPQIPDDLTGPAIDGSPVSAADDDGTFRLTLTGADRYRAGQPIDIVATLTYLGPDGATVARGSGSSLVGFGIESRDLPLRLGSASTTDCAPYDFVRDEPVVVPFEKSGGSSEDDPFNEFYESYIASPELRLPAGTWRVNAGVTLYIGDCGDELHALTTSVTIEVEP